MQRLPIYLALLHYPVLNRRGDTVTSSVTNLDIHDIARSSRTYGIRRYFLVTPLTDQQELVGRILAHWAGENAREAHPDRHEALSLVSIVPTFQELLNTITAEAGNAPEVVWTDARRYPNSQSYTDYRAVLNSGKLDRPVLILLGTGWGLAPEVLEKVDRVLAPIFGTEGEGGYNHLSVRAAAAVILDRLFGS